MNEILTRIFRASPAFELVLFDRLPEGERRALADLARDPDFYGVLRPRQGPGTLKSADRDTALLFLTLREPGPLPAYALAQLGEAAARVIARFVADGVLEVEKDGAFVSGPTGLDLLIRPALQDAGPRPEGRIPAGRIAALSLAALRCAQGLPADDPRLLSLRLYAYNRLPLTPRWQRLLPDTGAVERHLGVAPGGPCRKALDRGWQRLPEREGWISWISRAVAGAEGRPDGPTWKLYVSPRPEGLSEGGFGAVLDALTAARARQLKVGRDAAGLLRADKIVAYFPSFERLAEAAEAVVARLAGAPVQGVPFTSEIGGGGLLSWGMDPPRSERVWSLGESWRHWLALRLARDLLAARQAAGGSEGVEPWRFALDRLRLEGIDTDTWTPGALLWKE